MKKILLTGVDFNSPNRGVAALSYGALTCLLNKGSNIEIGVWNTQGFCKNVIKSQKVSLLSKKIPYYETNLATSTWILIISSIYRILPGLISRPLINKSFFLKKINEYDLIIDLSLGDSFSDFYTWKRAVLHSLTKFIPYNLGKPIYMFPQTIGPFRGRFGTTVCKMAINLVKKVYTRENISYGVTNKLLKDKSKLAYAADMAFLLQPDETYKIDSLVKIQNGYKYIGLNISGLLYVDKKRQELLGKEFDYPKLLMRTIELFLDKGKTKIVLIPHVYIQSNDNLYNFNEDDLVAIKDFYAKLPAKYKKKVIIVDENLDCRELKKIISSLDFFIGSRMHSCIAALSSNIPCVLISYSYKFRGILEKMRMTELECNPKKISEKKMLQRIEDIYKRKKQIKNKLIVSNKKMKESASSCGDILG